MGDIPTHHCDQGAGMPEKITKMALILGAIIGISFSAMLVAICVSTAWKVLSLSGLVGLTPTHISFISVL